MPAAPARRDRQTRILAGLRDLTASRSQLEEERARRANEATRHDNGVDAVAEVRREESYRRQAEAEIQRDLRRQKEHILSLAEREAEEKVKETEGERKARLKRNADKRRQAIENAANPRPERLDPPKKPNPKAKQQKRTKCRLATQMPNFQEGESDGESSPEAPSKTRVRDSRGKDKKRPAGENKESTQQDNSGTARPEQNPKSLDSKGIRDGKASAQKTKIQEGESDKDTSPEVPLMTQYRNQKVRNIGVEPPAEGKEWQVDEEEQSPHPDRLGSAEPKRTSENHRGRVVDIEELQRGRKRTREEDEQSREPKRVKLAQPTQDSETHEDRAGGVRVSAGEKKLPRDKSKQSQEPRRFKATEPSRDSENEKGRASSLDGTTKGKKRAASEDHQALPESKKIKTAQPLQRRNSASSIYNRDWKSFHSIEIAAKDANGRTKPEATGREQTTKPKKRGIARPIQSRKRYMDDGGTGSSQNIVDAGNKDVSAAAPKDKQAKFKQPLASIQEHNPPEDTNAPEARELVKLIDKKPTRLVYTDSYTSPEEKIATLPQYSVFAKSKGTSSKNPKKRSREEDEGKSDTPHKKQRTTEDGSEEKPATEGSPPAPKMPQKKISLSTYIARKKQEEDKGDESQPERDTAAL